MTVHKKLMQARIKLQNTELKKSGENKFAGYKYFELGDFLPQTMQIFHDLELCSVVSFDADYARLCITDTEDGTTLTITSPMAEANLKGAHPIQNLGAVLSYQRRYLWLAAMEVVEHDIIDASSGSEPPPKRTPPPIPSTQAAKVATLPKKMEGAAGPWQLSITLDESAGLQDWLNVVVDATRIALKNAKSEKDVMDIFKVNRVIFDRMKAESPEDHVAILGDFKKRKDELQGE
jgi:hypothetical protein